MDAALVLSFLQKYLCHSEWSNLFSMKPSQPFSLLRASNRVRISTIDYVAVFVTELLLHDVEIILGNTKHLEYFVFVEMRVKRTGLVGVADQGIKQYESFVIGLLHMLFS